MPSSVALQVDEHVRQAGFQNSENQQHRVRAAGTSTASDRQESKRDRTDEDLDAEQINGCQLVQHDLGESSRESPAQAGKNQLADRSMLSDIADEPGAGARQA